MPDNLTGTIGRQPRPSPILSIKRRTPRINHATRRAADSRWMLTRNYTRRVSCDWRKLLGGRQSIMR